MFDPSPRLGTKVIPCTYEHNTSSKRGCMTVKIKVCDRLLLNGILTKEKIWQQTSCM